MSRDCPRCLRCHQSCCAGTAPMRYDLGPRDEPDGDRNVVIDSIWRCDTCGYEVAVHVETWSDTEIRRRVDAIKAIRDVALDEMAEVLAEHGYEMGWRP